VPWLLAQIPATASVVVAFDGDGLDPSVLPAVSARAPGGLGYREAVDLISGLRGRLAGAAFTEYVPARDPEGAGALVVARLVAVAIDAAG
jgi:agmatinase